MRASMTRASVRASSGNHDWNWNWNWNSAGSSFVLLYLLNARSSKF